SAREGHRFISDQDARPLGSAHPKAHLWDNGTSAFEELNRLMQVRKHALAHLSLDHLRQGEPYSSLEDRMVPIYLLHRYQIEAVAKMIGGVDYDYAVKGDINYKTTPVESTSQRNALLAYLQALHPENLQLPKQLKTVLPPRSFSNPRTRENFLSQTGVTFDYLGVAHSLSNSLLALLLHPERANRLVAQYGFDSNQLGFEEVLTQLSNTHFKIRFREDHQQQLSELVKANLLKQLMHLGQHPNANALVKAHIHEELVRLDQWLAGQEDLSFGEYYRGLIDHYFDDPEDFVPPVSNRLPDGSPIGQFSCDY
ncbi:MAG: zinc-dependent metalloprotease, partial [Flavobacteriaceae bacterium]